MSPETDTTGNSSHEAADEGLDFRGERTYSPHPAPREPDDDVIRDYLDHELAPLEQTEVESLIVMYREWAEAESRIVLERFEAEKN